MREQKLNWKDCKPIIYSYEHGDKNLPRLKELATDIPDPQKDIIIEYLRTNCVAACPGSIKDEIEMGKIIGSGDLFSDALYYWDDVFTNYVEKYNIPVPSDFREHILKNYAKRKKSHALLRLVDRVEIVNNPYLGYHYYVIIQKNGIIKYWNNFEVKGIAVRKINPEHTAYMIDPLFTKLFCYDTGYKGSIVIDGHYWEIKFFSRDKLIKSAEGHTDEAAWRYNEIKSILEFIERYVPCDLGTEYMNLLP